MDTNPSLSRRLTLALISDASDLTSASADRACGALGPNPNPSLCFQSSVPIVLVHKHSTLGILEPQHSTLPALRGQKCLWDCTKAPNEDQLAGPSTALQFHRNPCALMFCLPQPDPQPPVSHQVSWPPIHVIRPAMPLGHHLYPTCVSRHLSPEACAQIPAYGEHDPQNRRPPAPQQEIL